MSVARTGDIERILGAGAPRRFDVRRIVVGGLLVGVVVALIAFVVARRGRESDVPAYRTEPVRRGDLVVTVSATGNLEPTNQVVVGSELSGIVETVLVDDNDRVTSGQVLAQLDTSRIEPDLERARATLRSAQASVAQAAATVRESNAKLTRLREVARLSGGRVPSSTELETAEATLARARADLNSARAAVSQARAEVSLNETNLYKASIRSPINGVVLARDVEPGQTVAASFQAPELFTLAEDLSKMELEVDVDEADVGQVKEGQSATFTVDAYPERSYPARITRVGLGAETVEGVVSYVAELSVANQDLSLRPGMTATALIETARREDVLLVPNAALRFSPDEREDAGPPSPGLVGRLTPRPPRSTSRRPRPTTGEPPRVWVLAGEKPGAVRIETGVSDGRMTEVEGGALRAGMQVITERTSAPP